MILLLLPIRLYFHLVKNQLNSIDPAFENQIIVEPERKNTAPAICLALRYLQDVIGVDQEECVLISSSDHIISPQKVFIDSLKIGEEIARSGRHVIFGIRPNKPETGYGYIKVQGGKSVGKVEKFVEKPDHATAQKYLLSGEYLWNSGTFLFQLETFFKEMAQFSPEIFQLSALGFKEMIANFSQMPDVSIDYASWSASTIPWSCFLMFPGLMSGSWDSVYDLLDKDQYQNAKVGNVIDMIQKIA